jgi:hypothetical protein
MDVRTKDTTHSILHHDYSLARNLGFPFTLGSAFYFFIFSLTTPSLIMTLSRQDNGLARLGGNL